MKVISVWQPYASLAVHGFKFFETRGWAAPKSIIGETIGIASTKVITSAQRQAMDDPEFRIFYANTLPQQHIEELPHGCLLGTVLVDSCELIDGELLENVTLEEKAFGWWEEGRYAWRLACPRPFARPIPVQGKQGIWNWDGDRVMDEIQRKLAARLISATDVNVLRFPG